MAERCIVCGEKTMNDLANHCAECYIVILGRGR